MSSVYTYIYKSFLVDTDNCMTTACSLHHFTVPLSLDSQPSQPHLTDRIAVVIPSKYEQVGRLLGLSMAQLQAIHPLQQRLEDHHRAFEEVFGERKRRGSPPYTWRTIIDVLRSAYIGEVLLADQLTSWLMRISVDP